MDDTKKPIAHCSECGEDVCVLSHTQRKLPHPSRVWPLVFWILLLIGFAVPISPWGQNQLGNSYAIWETTESNYVQPTDYLDTTVSIQDVELAAGGNLHAGDNVARWLEETLENEQTDDQLTQIWFHLTSLGGSRVIDNRHGFGGVWYWKLSMASLNDLSDPDSYGQSPYSTLQPSMTRLPLSFTEINHGGSEYVQTTYDIVGLLAHITLCLAIVYSIRRIGMRLNIRFGQSKRGRLTLFFILLISTGIYSVYFPYQNGVRSFGGINHGSTQAYSIADLQAIVDQPKGINEFVKTIASDLKAAAEDKASPENNLVLSMQIDRGYVSQTKNWLGSHGQYFPLIKLSRRSYYTSKTITESGRIEPPEHLRNQSLIDSGGLYWWKIRINGQNSLYWLGFSPGYLCFVIVCFYWVWKIAHWIPRKITRRIQSRRVRNKQCVFCNYPLSEEGLVARTGNSDSQNTTTT